MNQAIISISEARAMFARVESALNLKHLKRAAVPTRPSYLGDSYSLDEHHGLSMYAYFDPSGFRNGEDRFEVTLEFVEKGSLACFIVLQRLISQDAWQLSLGKAKEAKPDSPLAVEAAMLARQAGCHLGGRAFLGSTEQMLPVLVRLYASFHGGR